MIRATYKKLFKIQVHISFKIIKCTIKTKSISQEIEYQLITHFLLSSRSKDEYLKSNKNKQEQKKINYKTSIKYQEKINIMIAALRTRICSIVE